MLRREMVLQGKQRFGVETAESGMQSVDPRRPKGRWAGSVKSDRVRRFEQRIGPNVFYGGWVERGSDSPAAPSALKSSPFKGHRPVERGIDEARPGVRDLAYQVFGGLSR